MSTPAIGPILGDLLVYLDTDNAFIFPILDKNGVQVDVTGYNANLEIDADNTHEATKLTVAATVEDDPDNAGKKVLQVVIPDDLLQPGTGVGEWPLTNKPLRYPYSLKRTNDGSEKELRVGQIEIRRARV